MKIASKKGTILGRKKRKKGETRNKELQERKVLSPDSTKKPLNAGRELGAA